MGRLQGNACGRQSPRPHQLDESVEVVVLADHWDNAHVSCNGQERGELETNIGRSFNAVALYLDIAGKLFLTRSVVRVADCWPDMLAKEGL